MKRVKVSDNKKSIGRPRTGIGTLIGVRWSEAELAALDDWRRVQPDLPNRPQSIRRLVELALQDEADGKAVDRFREKLARGEEKLIPADVAKRTLKLGKGRTRRTK